MIARVAPPLSVAPHHANAYLVRTSTLLPPDSIKLSIPFLQSLHPLPSQLPSLPPKRRNGGKGSTIETARGGQLARSIGGKQKTKSQINVSVVAVSSLEEKEPELTRGKCRHCIKCSRAKVARSLEQGVASSSRRPLYALDEIPIERKAEWALEALLGERESGRVSDDQSCPWSASAANEKSAELLGSSRHREPSIRRQSISVDPAVTPLAARPLSPPPTIASPPRRRPQTQCKASSALSSITASRAPHNECETIHSSIQLATYSSSPFLPLPALRQRHSSPLSGASISSEGGRGREERQRRKSCPPCTPLRIQVLEWRMVQCGKLAGVRVRGGDDAAGGIREASATRWNAP